MSTTGVHRQLVVFDFDWSLADQDSDDYTFEVLAPDIRRYMRSAELHVQWTDLVAQSLAKIHARGITREQIENTLIGMPFHPAMVRAVSNLKAKGQTTFLCLSNANQVFINTILKSKGLDDLFDEIVTNPAEWDSSGLLMLRRRIDPNGVQHNCKVGCSPNMCKGEELEAFLARNTPPYDSIIYVGDGLNDFCPVLRLRSQDKVLCRSDRGLQQRIVAEGEKEGLKAKVQYWAGAWEVEEIFAQL